MRKVFTLLVAMACSFASFAQDIQLETKDGQVIENGSTLTVRSEMVDMMVWGQLDADIYVRNLTEQKQGVIAEMKVVSGGDTQICWGNGCVIVPVGNSYTTGMGVVSASSSASLLVESLVMTPGYMDAVVTRTIEITVWTDKKPNEKVSATVTFTNDPTLSIGNTEITSPIVYAKDNVLYCQFADAANRQLQVYDVAGKLWKNVRLTSENESLPLEGRTKGLYIYRVMEAGKPVVSGKFLVK
ncbi:MAG: T9SS type A sorting domain-containing protein [Bacteroidaceae bacterium]|nr:T9SS type A sorting domain-containing protein [Bacteroidaceae bacterium]